jgi:hypothetical protein
VCSSGRSADGSFHLGRSSYRRGVLPARFTTERQLVLRPAVAFSKKIQIKGNFTEVTLHSYFKCIMYYAGLLLYSVYCQ